MSFSLRRLGAALVAATAAVLLSPLAAQAATVAVFDDPTYVDTAGVLGSESDNLQGALTAAGHTVKAFNGISATAFSTGLAGATVLVIPEREVAPLAPDLSDDAVHTLSGAGL